MPAGQDHQQKSHSDMVAAARQDLMDELGCGETGLGQAFLELPIGPRDRAGAVRSSLARYVAERLRGGILYGSFVEASDEVVLHVPATLQLRENLTLPVFAPLTLKLGQFVWDVAEREGPTVAAELLARKPTGVAQAEQRLREAPPAFQGWSELEQSDIRRVFDREPPLLTDLKGLYQRIKTSCAHAVQRTLLDELARDNPGFVDYLQCFPRARTLKRKVIAWLGPTNSGKTYQAIQALAKASSGMYLGPLRLLALEQRDRLVEMGVACSLITGEEREETSATHSARTVEMTDFSEHFEVCVLDEMQLAFDRDRGWAWVAAYCGAAADNLIITGPASVEPVVRRLAALCGDEVEIKLLNRQGTLQYEAVLDWRQIPPRSAVIGFSRAMVLELKAMFESQGLKVSVIYGGLSPEVRRAEARRFRNGESDLVVATDAIGLGLNLPLDRVIFYEVDKFDGETNRPLSHGELMQIAGRAGRGPGSAGLVAALSARDGRRVANALAEPQKTPDAETLPAAPTPMHIRAIANHLGSDALSPILEFFQTRLTFPGGTFTPEVQPSVLEAAALVDSLAPKLSPEKRYALACAPVALDDHFFLSIYSNWIETLAAGRPVSFPRRIDDQDQGGLEALENTLKLITLYRWLALKFPGSFTDQAYVSQLRREATEQSLAILRRNWGKYGFERIECVECGRALLPSSPYRTCRECYKAGG
jgi:ATP-dependent RNA helicase SUPV3L1/SUV3